MYLHHSDLVGEYLRMTVCCKYITPGSKCDVVTSQRFGAEWARWWGMARPRLNQGLGIGFGSTNKSCAALNLWFKISIRILTLAPNGRCRIEVAVNSGGTRVLDVLTSQRIGVNTLGYKCDVLTSQRVGRWIPWDVSVMYLHYGGLAPTGRSPPRMGIEPGGRILAWVH